MGDFIMKAMWLFTRIVPTAGTIFFGVGMYNGWKNSVPEDLVDFRELNGGIPPRRISPDSPLLTGRSNIVATMDDIRNAGNE
mmetsp:Transcript_3677/g.6453  ORF Transcript_3677/g.6453 Transcript_3677/m.6453 type:complete len:82 (-) Transcript_3677:429-674(-)|eukprot:CAMPEP_0182447020 /NCGR_PEP_ID=MMETSP1172-20130603/10246_1 /TAXON_ID=708627 /ORGANISM="Timspurckia oligopyrenoides, Strain CCMP3278" /LENGTH=81 /DNA_ID=CAMNT_0024643265 /DNA_START=25 /DNA_END=270 /DNA_ORIENTATION=-